ncbi:hypothetical protein GCM10023186_36080 [Hymenobacter koreensis]|uniref:RCC1-like domain-containing protein n=2 Tax=Hymenobacter koreensis TaxID=1084523 RepID=A0ABP8JDK2_9BACT
MTSLRGLLSLYLLLACGGGLRAQQHSVWVRADGALWTWGRNTFGQLGDGTLVDKRVPTVVGTSTAWRTAVAGGNFTVALQQDGSLWTWGHNYDGQLGTGSNNDRAVPGRVGTATWVSVGAGVEHAVAVRQDGTLWAWGSNGNGRLGTNFPFALLSPGRVGTAANWQSVTAGADFTLAIKTDGTLWAWGRNDQGQLGDGTTTDRLTPVQIGTATNWRHITAGLAHVVGLRQDGSAWAWGFNSSGQLGLGTAVRNQLVPTPLGAGAAWASVAAGGSHTLAVRQDGTLWGCGGNDAGQLGDSTFLNRSSLTQVGVLRTWHSVVAITSHSVAARRDGTLWGWGNSSFGQVGSALLGMTNEPAPFRVQPGWTWRSMSAGSGHGMGIRSDGTLWGWGDNDDGQLGDSTLNRQVLPVRIGRDTNWQTVVAGQGHTLALKTDGTLWAWGRNDQGQLGLGTTGPVAAEPSVPRQVGTATTWRSVAVAGSYTLALRQDGTLWAWGSNQGQFGDGTTTSRNVPTRVGTLTTWQSISAAAGVAHGIRTDGSLWGWGSSGFGQVGDGTTTVRLSPVQIGTATNWQSVSDGSSYALATRTDGTLWSWGRNTEGQLGNGSTGTGRTSPGQVGSGTTWLAAQGGAGHSLALRQDGTLWSWGRNDSGQLGIGSSSTPPLAVPRQAGTALWAAVRGGAIFSLGLQPDGTLWGWGSNARGQLGIPLRSPVPLLIAGNAVPLATRTNSRRAADFVAYPTVASEAVHYAYAGSLLPTDATLEVLRLNGQRVAQWPLNSAAPRGQMAVADLAPGWYVLRLRTSRSSYVARFLRP